MKREEVANQLKAFDPEIYTLLEDERQRQRYTLSLLPNMNAMSPFAKYLEGSILTNSVYERSNKATSLGLRLTSIVCARAKELFHSDHAIVSGASPPPRASCSKRSSTPAIRSCRSTCASRTMP